MSWTEVYKLMINFRESTKVRTLTIIHYMKTIIIMILLLD